MTRDEKIALCRRLKGEGLSVRAIAMKTGIPRATVGDFLIGDTQRRTRELARNPRCPRCNGPMGGNRQGAQRCGKCFHAESVATGRKLEALWAAGLTYGAIQKKMGWTKGGLSMRMFYYRERGYNLPYRRQGEALENIRRANSRRSDRVAA